MTHEDREERAILRRLNRSLAKERQFVRVSRKGQPARYLLCDAHTGNFEAWADTLDGWEREMGGAP